MFQKIKMFLSLFFLTALGLIFLIFFHQTDSGRKWFDQKAPRALSVLIINLEKLACQHQIKKISFCNFDSEDLNIKLKSALEEKIDPLVENTQEQAKEIVYNSISNQAIKQDSQHFFWQVLKKMLPAKTE